MAHVNRTELEGNLTADSVLKYTATGVPLLTFSIANNLYQGKDKQDYTSFFNCVIWGKLAERMANKIIKGCTILFSCNLKMESYKDKTGANRTTLKCVIGIGDHIRFTYRSEEAITRHNAVAAQQQNQQPPPFVGTQPRPPAFGAQPQQPPVFGNPAPQPPVNISNPVVTAYSAPQNQAKPPTHGQQQVADLFGGEFEDDIPF